MIADRHIITGEFPPEAGGVADYTATVARALAAAGEEVHVWCGGRGPAPVREDGVVVHRSMGAFDRVGLAAADDELQRQPEPRRLHVQWVPHAYGRRSLNLDFCRWVRRRVRRYGDRLEVTVHEPFLSFGGNARQTAAAGMHRLMAHLVLGSASRVWVVTPAWERLCRPYARRARFEWTPVPSGIPACADHSGASDVRRELDVPPGALLAGSFGRFPPEQQTAIADSLAALQASHGEAFLLLIGTGSHEARAMIARNQPGLASRIHATGVVPAPHVSRLLRACDVLVQPYPSGICGRHSSASAALAHGCAIVATEGRYTEPLWRESGAVRLVTIGSRQRIADAVVDLAADAAERVRLAERARALYDRRFDVRHTVAALRA